MLHSMWEYLQFVHIATVSCGNEMFKVKPDLCQVEANVIIVMRKDIHVLKPGEDKIAFDCKEKKFNVSWTIVKELKEGW